MLKKGDLKLVALVAAGVAVAGLVFSQFGDVPGIKEARNGFDY